MKKALLLLLLAATGPPAPAQGLRWPDITTETKPWTRWWWQGSAVNDQDLTRLLTQYQQAGLGGVEITPIYGVKGYESQFISFLSPTWMDRLAHTLTEAKCLGLGVDMAQASGWPFGGPWVTPEDACKYVTYRTYSLKGGEQLSEAISFVQKPILRTIGQPIAPDKLLDPVAKNPDLQLHAFDQVRFEKPLPLQTLMAYSDKDKVLDLTSKVAADGRLSWQAPAGSWTLYALFQGWHGKQVERAGPGGEGDVIDHFSQTATQHYLQRFDEAFGGRDVSGVRAFFNDSYEVDDAQGEANWTPQFFSEFRQRRGYDLHPHLPTLLSKTDDEAHQRILTDYRATISELLLENYTRTWHRWAAGHGALIRNQAHGSPANILDLYAATDIPETEGEDLLRIKFASSAAHVTGKKLTSAETATWENEHFLTKLSDAKLAVDRMLLGGVNHVFYHGTNYSPQAAAWPGWLFYAAVHFNPNNTFWPDFGQLNRYAAHCQSFLQAGQPANEVLVYLPIYDAYAKPGKNLLQHFDGISHGFKGMPVGQTGETLLQKGYSFDFISDKQVQQLTTADGRLLTGGTSYQTILLPAARTVPLPTLTQLFELAENGATVLVQNELPADVPGLGQLKKRRKALRKLLAKLHWQPSGRPGIEQARLGRGQVLRGADVNELLAQANVPRETLVDSNLAFIRRRHSRGHYYFLRNEGSQKIAAWVPLQATAQAVALYNPMSEKLGLAAWRSPAPGRTEAYVQLAPGESCILETSDQALSGAPYAYEMAAGPAQPLTGPWQVQFVEGGPVLPPSFQTNALASWTKQPGEAVKNFAGAATYSLDFAAPTATADGWLLDLGQVMESAQVQLNGQPLGTLIGPVYQVFIANNQLKANNKLVITVRSGMANRIADLDRRHVAWKNAYNVNIAAKLKENRDANGLFTAESWPVREAGLLGPVTLTPVRSGLPVN